MIILRTVEALRACLKETEGYSRSSGFVPTMGALHEGHLSLIVQSKAENRYCISSVFVNPTQFNDPSDFDKYPVTISDDIKKLEEAGCDILFLPSVKEMYPAGTSGLETYALGNLETRLEGFYRPNHFQGVCQVVYRLLKAVQPSTLYLGQKDFQQVMVIRKMIELVGLAVEVKILPTMREANGLAMSSRNLRLSVLERRQASAIYQELQMIKDQVDSVSPRKLEELARQQLLDAGFSSVDYVAIVQPHDLAPVENYTPGMPAVALVAAYMGDVRLIDNMIL
jgi:pantoate--beta-alanine ligase